jgi:maleylacetate reductase
MTPFIFDARLPRVVFADGALASLPDEVARLGSRRVLVLCTPQQTEHADRVGALLDTLAVARFDRAVMHVPVATVSAAAEVARAAQADLAVAIGGGSTIGLAKALALHHDLPFVAVPTTYAGSEMTPIYGLTDQGIKRTGRDPRVLARTVLYDPSLSLQLPLGMTVVSGLNAIAHAAEGLYAPDGNPVLGSMAEEGVRAVAGAIDGLVAAPADAALRAQALYGAWLCGVVLGNAGMGLHHKLCHTLGGSFDLPHAEVHAVVLPHALAYNAAAAPDAMRRLARAIGVDDAAQVPRGLFDLSRRCGAPSSLREIGMREADLDRATDLALQQRYPNPRALEPAAIRALLHRAFDGAAPQ